MGNRTAGLTATVSRGPGRGPKAAHVELTIFEDVCTGCKICVEVCPTNVLAMKPEPRVVSGLLAYVVDHSACTKCMLCEVNCPDFCITVS